MPDDTPDASPQVASQDGAATADAAEGRSAPAAVPSGYVPVGESIKYRRRAQQAEGRAQQLEQQLEDLRTQVDRHSDQLATAEAQRDETRQHLAAAENRLAAERLLADAGVGDLEAASLLLAQRVDLGEELERDELARQVEQLVVDKPFLRGGARGGAGLPPASASSRASDAPLGARLAQAADRAIRSGDRRAVADYLRLRREAAS
ncbi:MAG: hypothetical protein KGY99_06110 [Phycisphaerae bacterium]|nr:hypothetical protein [Phycisphaerae bacterium]